MNNSFQPIKIFPFMSSLNKKDKFIYIFKLKWLTIQINKTF